MKIVSIEPTPSPNTMKINLDEELTGGKSNNYTKANASDAPIYIQQLLAIEGVKGVYHVADFLALERNARVAWEDILPQARSVFGEVAENEEKRSAQQLNDHFGEIKVFFQMFRGIPMQVKLSNDEEEKRVGLPERFMNTVMKAKDVVLERKWVEQGIRYGDMEDIGAQIVEEISALYSEDRLLELLSEAENQDDKNVPERKKEIVTMAMLSDPDWKNRYAALDKLDPTKDDVPVLAKALVDEKAAIRRLAVVYLGMIEDEAVLEYLYKAVLDDPSVTVRRTAGDCLSDIGNSGAIPTMIKVLQDKNKLVRWRAAMFLYEVGDQSAIPALKAAQDDPEFEVAMQVKMALNRIESGHEAEGSVWKQMTDSISKNK